MTILLKVREKPDTTTRTADVIAVNYGVVGDKPKIIDSVLHVSPFMLAKRGLPDGVYDGTTCITVEHGGDSYLIVKHDDAFASYFLMPEQLEWSDGPPHPSNLCLAALQGYKNVAVRNA